MSGRGGQEGGYLEDVGGVLTQDMEDRVISDVMNHVLLPQVLFKGTIIIIHVVHFWREGGSSVNIFVGQSPELFVLRGFCPSSTFRSCLNSIKKQKLYGKKLIRSLKKAPLDL